MGRRRARVDLPVETPWQRSAWATFLRDGAERYGPDGSFWVEHPDVPYLPIRTWEIWNEENIVTFSDPTDPSTTRGCCAHSAGSFTRPTPART